MVTLDVVIWQPICSLGLEHTLETWLEVRRNVNSESVDIFIKKVFILICVDLLAIFIRVGLYTIFSLVLVLHAPLYRVITQNLEYS